MKVKRLRKECKFVPIEIKITLETQEEAGYFFCIMNHTNILMATNNIINGTMIRNEIKSNNESEYDYASYFKLFKEKLKQLVQETD